MGTSISTTLGGHVCLGLQLIIQSLIRGYIMIIMFIELGQESYNSRHLYTTALKTIYYRHISKDSVLGQAFYGYYLAPIDRLGL